MSLGDILRENQIGTHATAKPASPSFRLNLEKGELEFDSEVQIAPEDEHLAVE